jgi:hypothetical protein
MKAPKKGSNIPDPVGRNRAIIGVGENEHGKMRGGRHIPRQYLHVSLQLQASQLAVLGKSEL